METYGIIARVTTHLRSVAGDTIEERDRQCRIIVAAPSVAAATRAFQLAGFDITPNHMREYGSPTANATELALTADAPMAVFAARSHVHNGYVRVPHDPWMLLDADGLAAMQRIASGGVAGTGKVYDPQADGIDRSVLLSLTQRRYAKESKGMWQVTPLGKYAMQVSDPQEA